MNFVPLCYHKVLRKLALGFLLLAIIFPLVFAFSSSQAAELQTATGKRVVDGDTLILSNGGRVRLTKIAN